MASSSKKCKKPSQDNTNDVAPIQASKAKRLGACTKCKVAKSRCELGNGASACARCVKIGLPDECIRQESSTHPVMTTSCQPVDPLTLPSAPQKRATSVVPTSQKPSSESSRKRSKSDAKITQSVTQSQIRQQRSPSREPMVAVTQTSELDGPTLYSIPESDNDNMSNLYSPPLDVFNLFVDPQEGAKEFLSTLGNSVMLSEPEDGSEDYAQELDAVSSTTNSDHGSESNGTDDAFLQSSLPPPPLPAAKKKSKPKSTGAVQLESTYDPQTCSFVIPCVVRKPNGTNSPFNIKSKITYDKLCDSIAAKLNCYGPALKLQYRLDPNNTKHAATSIQSEQELALFIARMRPMLVPPCLANGKPSTRPLKNVLVYFEDGSSDDESANPPNACNSKPGNRTASKASTSESKQSSSSGSNVVDESAACLQESIDQLQKKYMCKVHTKTPDSPVFCFPGANETCLILTHSHISFWACEIRNGIGTVDDKPPMLYPHAMRPRTRTQPTATAGPDPMPPTFNPAGGYPYPPVPPQVIVLPSPWGGGLQGPGYIGTQRGNGYIHPPVAQPGNANMPAPHMAVQGSSSGRVDSSRSTSPAFSTTTTFTDALLSIDDIPFAKIPSIAAWLKSLDDHEDRGKDNIGFTRFAPIFEQDGFIRLLQLSGDFISWNELQEMLGIPRGMALLLMQYAKQDL